VSFRLEAGTQMAVITAWRLFDFLETDERFVMPRKEGDRKIAEEKAKAHSL